MSSNKFKGHLFRKVNDEGQPNGPYLCATFSSKFCILGISTAEKINPLYESHTEYLVQKSCAFFPKHLAIHTEYATCSKVGKNSFAKPVILKFKLNDRSRKWLKEGYQIAELYTNNGYRVYAKIKSIRLSYCFSEQKDYVDVELEEKLYETFV